MRREEKGSQKEEKGQLDDGRRKKTKTKTVQYRRTPHGFRCKLHDRAEQNSVYFLWVLRIWGSTTGLTEKILRPTGIYGGLIWLCELFMSHLRARDELFICFRKPFPEKWRFLSPFCLLLGSFVGAPHKLIFCDFSSVSANLVRLSGYSQEWVKEP